jgi:hypothetical protein
VEILSAVRCNGPATSLIWVRPSLALVTASDITTSRRGDHLSAASVRQRGWAAEAPRGPHTVASSSRVGFRRGQGKAPPTQIMLGAITRGLVRLATGRNYRAARRVLGNILRANWTKELPTDKEICREYSGNGLFLGWHFKAR